jgi:aspartyl-tRNA(Asn)/glutamyl-tRNA(Gln) amidotransferase subunit C
MAQKSFTVSDVTAIAKLANIPVSESEKQKLAEGFTTTMKVVDELTQVNVTGVEPTHQVTGLENVFREDEIDVERQFSQDEALANAPRTHNGFFVVNRVIEDS